MKVVREYPVTIPVSFHHDVVGANDRLVLFLHGFTDSGSSFSRRILKNTHIQGASTLAPNGPFPTPVRIENSFKEAYAWYFWEMTKDNLVVHPRVAVSILKKMIEDLGYENKPKVVVGFSQGAFLAPFLFPALKNIKGFAAIGAAYRTQDYAENFSFPMQAYHGDQDEVIGLENSQKSFAELIASGKIKGEYQVIGGLKHTVNEELASSLSAKIQSWW